MSATEAMNTNAAAASESTPQVGRVPGVRIVGTGSALPSRTVTNDDLAQIVDTSDEWIASRTGIRFRRIAGAGEQNYQLAAKAGRRALAITGIDPEELDLIIVATISPHMIMHSTACFVQA